MSKKASAAIEEVMALVRKLADEVEDTGFFLDQLIFELDDYERDTDNWEDDEE